MRLADLDGSGAADLIYLESDRLLSFLNQGGNRFAQPVPLAWPDGVRYDNTCQVSFADARHWLCGAGIDRAASVARQIQTDEITGNTLTQCYTYRHGFYDGHERAPEDYARSITGRGARDPSCNTRGANLGCRKTICHSQLHKFWIPANRSDRAALPIYLSKS